MEVKMEVKVGVKMDNTFCDNNTFVHFNFLFNSPFNSLFIDVSPLDFLNQL